MSELPREVPSPVGRSARLIQSNPRSKREAGRRWCAVPPAEAHYWKQAVVCGPFGSVATGTVVEH